MKNNFKRVIALFMMVVMLSSSFTGTLAEGMSSVAPDSMVTTETNSDKTNSSEESDSNSDSTSQETTSESSSDSSSEETSEGKPDSDTETPSAPDSSSGDLSSVPEPPVNSDSVDMTPLEPSISATPEADKKEFIPLTIQDQTKSLDAQIGENVEFSVTLNRSDVNVRYQWQKNYTPPKEEVIYGTEIKVETEEDKINEDMFSKGGYQWLIEDASEAEWLKDHPDIIWQGKELWDEAVILAGGDTSKVHIPNGAKSIADVTIDGVTISSEGIVIEDEIIEAPVAGWVDMEGEKNPKLAVLTTEEDRNTIYRCIITIDDEAYFAEAAASTQTETSTGENETDVPAEVAATTETPIENDDTIIFNTALIATTITSSDMKVTLPEKIDAVQTFNRFAQRMATPRAAGLNVYREGDYLVGLDKMAMEYITKNAYDNFSCSNANNSYWTKLNGGTRPDGTGYVGATVSSAGKMPILSAWYGKTVYVRYVGSSGTGVAIDIPAYTGMDYQTGQKTVYKNAVTVLSVRVPETSSVDFYTQYIQANSNSSTFELYGDANGAAIFTSRAPLTQNGATDTAHQNYFNNNPDRYLKDAEGNYRFDSVMVGVCVANDEPDLSGKAAWALKEYISEGYGFMTGHDMMYGYGGVTDSSYTPDRYNTRTPYYTYYSGVDGHWNMNWLMGVNKKYTNASPYEAASMILCTGNDFEKSLYGTGSDKDSRLRVTKVADGNPLIDTSSRTPTNYPYSTFNDGAAIGMGDTFPSKSTHSCMQIAYGDIWFEFTENDFADSGEIGRLIIDKREGLTGTNNFYLTTNGNLAMNQVGHLESGTVKANEMRVFANTVMYISQRQQCQVCQSEQGGNTDVHFVHKIRSAEELAKLRNQRENWFTYPTNGCYMLSNDIVLPDDWEPIQGFYGHFSADGHQVTLGLNKAPIFKNTEGTLGQFSTSDAKGWNLGTDKTKGLNSIVNAKKERSTGTARVSGYLGVLFETGHTVDYSGYKVVVEGTDGNKYNCTVNLDGKYTISNVPTTGIMTARVYDRAGTEVTSYGPVRVNVSDTYWDTNETTPLYLIGFTAQPVKNTEVYEGETAYMVEGAVNWHKEVTNITWQYLVPETSTWRDMSSTTLFDYEYGKSNFVEKGDDSYTETSLIIKNCPEDFSGYKFRAVFKDGAMQTDTYKYKTNAKSGLLTVKPMPMYVTSPVSQTVWVDGSTEFVSSCEAVKGSDDGLRVQWQVRRWMSDSWMNVESYPDLVIAPTSTTITNVQTDDGKTNPLTPYKTTSTLSIKVAPVSLTGLYFRAVYSYENPFGKTRSKESDGEAQVIVNPPEAEVIWAVDQDTKLGITFENPAIVPAGSEYSSDVVKYEADIYYKPGPAETTNGSPTPEVRWQYLNHGMLGSVGQTTWNAATASALAIKLGIAAPSITFNNSDPVKQADGRYKITAKMEISNIHWKLYSNDCFLEFSVGPILHYETDPYKDFSTLSDPKGMFVDYKVGIKWNQGKETANGDHTVWTYPNMTVNSASGVKTMLLYFEGAVGTDFDARDKIVLKDNLLPPGMVIDVNSSKYLMFTVNGPNAVPDTVIQKYLRENISLVSYDTTKNPKIMAYINAETDFATNVKTRSGIAVKFLTDAKTPLEGQTSFTFLQPNTVIDVPTPVADEYYEFIGWEDEYGRSLSFWDTISISKSGSYTAKFKPVNDTNRNNIPDEYEVIVTFKVENGMFKENIQPHQEWSKSVTLLDENGNPSPSGQATLSPSDYPSVFANDGYVIGEWDNAVITTATTLTNKCTKVVSKNADEETDNIIVLFTDSKGLLDGQTQYVVPVGSTWGEANISIPTAKAVETEKVNGIVETISFAKWNKEIPADDYVFTGEDGDVLAFIAEFSQENAVSGKAALAKKRDSLQIANNFADKMVGQAATRSATPRYAGATLTITGNTGSGMSEGSSLSLAANGSAPYMQWEVNDKSGIWYKCTAENYQTMIISRLLGNMEGWQYRLRYGNSEADSRVSNVVTVQYAFSNVYVGSESTVRLSRSAGNGNTVFYPAKYAGRVNHVAYTFSVNNGWATTISAYFNNDGGSFALVDADKAGWDYLTNPQSYNLRFGKFVSGGRSIYAFHYSPESHASGTFTIRDIAISGVGGTGGSDSGITIKRGIYEALDLTSIWHQKTVDNTPNIVATTSASNKVYNGEESVASVTLFDRSGSLTPAQLETIKANGTLQYSNGKTTVGNAIKGSDCIDVGTYKATFVPSSGDAKYFTSNSIEEIRSRTATFNITKRPVNLFSTENNKVYDGSVNAIIRNIAIEALNTETNTGVVNRDTGRVDVNPKTLNGLYVDQNQTNGIQIKINPIGAVNLIGDRANNYAIQSVNYTGAITPRSLAIHSLYKDAGDTANNPRNIKQYDNTDVAKISKILIDNIVAGDEVWVDKASYTGHYETMNAGETLDENGKVLKDHLTKLKENPITRTEAISLINNEKGNYVIGTENYSGAIYRALAEYMVSKKSVIYGDGFNGKLTTANTYTNTEVGNGTDLNFGILLGTDKLKIDKNKSDFVFSQKIDKNTPAGVYKIRYQGLTEDNYPVLSNYVVLGNEGSIIVNPRPLSVKVAGGYEKKYGEQLPEFGVTITGWADNGDNIANSLYGSLKFSTQCKWNSEVRYLSDGVTIAPYGVTASGLYVKSNDNGWQNYEIEYTHGTIKVLPAEITIQAIEKTKTYGYGDPYFDFTMSMARVKENDLQFDLSRIKGENVGRYDIIFDDSKITERDRGNYRIKFIPAKLTINPRTLFINASSYVRYYGNENPKFEVRYSGFGNGDTKENALENTLKIDTMATKLSPVGNYNIGLSDEKVKKNINGLYNYDIVYVNGSLNVIPRPVTVIADDKVKYAGEKDPELTWHFANNESVIDSDRAPFKVELTRTPGEETYGTYPITADEEKLREENTNYLVTFIPGNLTILKDNVTDLIIKVGNATSVYGENEPVNDYKLIWYMDESGKHDLLQGTDIRDIPELKLSGNLSLKADGDGIRDVGVYAINGTGLVSGKYERVVIIPGDLTVTPRPVTLTPQDQTKVYGEMDPTLTYSLTDEITGITYDDGTDPAARVKEGDLNGALGRRVGEVVGKYIIGVGTLGDDANYSITLERGFLTITPADLIITVKNPASEDGIFTRPYGKENPKFNIQIDGFKNGDTINSLYGTAEYHTLAEKTSPVGEYPVSVEGFESENYNIHYIPGTLKVIPLDITIIVENTTKEYGEKDPDFAWHFPEGVPFNPEDIIGELDREDGEDVGDYLITGEFTSKDTNVGTITVFPGILTITPAKLMVTAEDKTKVYGDKNPEWTSKVEGLKNGDTLETLEGKVVYSVKESDKTTDVSKTTNVGKYPIDITSKSTLNSKNYTIEYIDAELEITKRPIDIAPGDPDSAKRNLTIEKTADKTSAKVGETINYMLTVTNTGSEDLENILVADNNDGTGAITAQNGQGYTYNGDKTFTIARLPSGGKVVILYSYLVVETDAGKDIKNLAVAKLPGNPDDPTDPGKDIPSNEVIVPVDPIKGLFIVKSADKTHANVGETISYTIRIKNTGSEVLTNVLVDDGMTGAGEILATDGNGYTYNGNGNFTIASLAPNATIEINYTYVALEADAGKDLINIAVATIPAISGDPSDPANPGTPEEKVPSNPVEIPVDDTNLKITKKADVAFANVGETITYTVEVTNLGTTTLSNVLVKDNNDGAGDIVVTGGANYVYDETQKLFTIPSIAAGETVSIVYTYTTVEADAGKVIVNTAIATIDTPTEPGKEIPSEKVEVPVKDPSKGPITVRPDPYFKVYGDKDPELTYKISEALVKPDDVWGNVEREVGEDVQVYPINRGTVDSDNYEINFIPGTFEIVPAPLTITALDAERFVDTENPDFQATYSGFKFEDEPKDLGGKLSISTTAERTSPVGKYPIVPTGHSSKNYTITYVDGVLTVKDGSEITIEKTADKTTVKVGETVTYTITVSNAGTRDATNLKVTDTMQASGSITAKDGNGYEYLGNGEFIIPILKAGQSIEITYTYTAETSDAGNVLRNVAVVKVPSTGPEDPEKEIPSDPVEIPVDDVRGLQITKSANVSSAKVGDRVTYTLTVKNTGTVPLDGVIVKDKTAGKGSMIAASGKDYTYDGNNQWTIATLPVGKTAYIVYDYIIAEADAGTTVKNVAVATIPAIPAIPGDPNDPSNPGKPAVPPVDVPSNEVNIPVAPLPGAPVAPEKPPVIVTVNPRTGLGFMTKGMYALLATLSITAIAFAGAVISNKRKKK